MKKFISMVMAAAMVVSLVPATAFAAEADNSATVKVVKELEVTSAQAKDKPKVVHYTSNLPQLQMTITSVDSLKGVQDTFTIELDYDNVVAAELKVEDVSVYRPGDKEAALSPDVKVALDETTATIKIKEAVDTTGGASIVEDLKVGDVIAIKLRGTLDRYSVGTSATVAVSGDFGSFEAKPYFTVCGQELRASVKDTVAVAEDEVVTLKDITVEAAVGKLPAELTLKLSKGFEFVSTDDKEMTWDVTGNAKEVIKNVEIAATTAKPGDVATIKVSAKGWEPASVEVAKVIDYKVVMELADPDEDMPVIYSGVNEGNFGINDDADHVSLEVKLYETFAGAWDMDKAFTLSLPEGVYVTEAKVVDGDLAVRPDNAATSVENAFERAYIKGEHVDFEFAKRVFLETDPQDDDHKRDYASDVTFTLKLVADPGFAGDVTLKLEGAAVDTQEVVIAKFVTPYTVKAEQNDVIIDYRYTEIPTAIVVTEAEAGLWNTDFALEFAMEEVVESQEYIIFEDNATVSVNEESEMEVDADDYTHKLGFKVTEESDEEAAVVTIDGVELFMQRNIPAGPYALNVKASEEYDGVTLLGQVDEQGAKVCAHTDCSKLGDVADYSTTVHEAWVNVVTAGRDQDDNSFTTTVVVPVGETTIYAGEKAITLDVPAYINANGYIMVPVRAVANALGIANDCVQWNQAAKTVIIMYGNRLITMAAGSSTIYVGGAPLPAASSVEVVDGRAFLGLRDLANALGVKTIDWNAETKVGTLNPKA